MKRYMHLHAHSSTVYNSHSTEATQVSLNKQIMKTGHIRMMEYYSAITKNEVMSFAATQTDLEIVIHGGLQPRLGD